MSGFEVLEAADAIQAMAVFQADGSAVDLVITDVQMPEMNGCDLARILLATHPNLPILLVSGAQSEPPEPFLSCKSHLRRPVCATLSRRCWELEH